MIGAGTINHVACHVLDCKVTGKAPDTEGRPFICAKHMGVCNSVTLTAHANAAANLIAHRAGVADRSLTVRQRADHLGQARVYERIEAKAWWSLHDQVAAKFEVRS